MRRNQLFREIMNKTTSRLSMEVSKKVRSSKMKLTNRTTFTASMIRPKIKIYSLRWEFHQNDSDIFPSIPHGHCYEKNLKLSYPSGNVYRNKHIVGKASKNEMMALKSNPQFKQFLLDLYNAKPEKYSGVFLKTSLNPIFINLTCEMFF